MTGPEHYRAAERCLENAAKADDREDAEYYQREAQVHAQLATAAAVGCAIRGSDTVAWEATAGPQARSHG